MNVAVYSRKILKHEVSFFKRFFTHLEQINWNAIIEKDFYEQLKAQVGLKEGYDTFNSHSDFVSGIDIAISIGGDGTFLKCVSYVRSSGVPILGVNTGRLGFLADTNTGDFELTLNRLLKQDYVYQQRSLIRVETEENIFGDQNLALNELAVHKKDTASMITVEAYLGGEYLNSYWADGLLVGTPTGSTAYSLSCGGPIISPGCNVHFLTPIAAHNLNVRPVIVPDHIPITLKAVGRDRNFLLTLDSLSKPVKNGTEITLYKSDFNINVIKFKENDFFKIIREKMLWGIDQRNE
ncbi:NAD kinase [Brumimicrobium salinarum]|uniref:NAD kinase n=1 Tax=Brumimicrobium salinarum TaxID=2058658 RepID=A0A2I0R0V6_9FLAO|nr:NAD kinase [Brumimicrobium salinarum]PKR80216.1 NAD kinase [Brumimicrobium salinarum]